MLSEMFGGDKEFVTMLFGQYLQDNKDANVKIQEQYDNNDLETLFHTMHTLAGALSNICETDVVPTLKEVEKVSKEGTTPNKADIETIKIELDKIIVQMEEYLS